MALRQEETFWDLFSKCCVCSDRVNSYSEPKITPCLHSICSKCSRNNSAFCTFCKTSLAFKPLKENVFLVNHFAETDYGADARGGEEGRGVGAGGAEPGVGDEPPDGIADGPEEPEPSAAPDGKEDCMCCQEKKEVVTFCKNCTGMICTDCVQLHQHLQPLRRHVTLGKNRFQAKAYQLLNKSSLIQFNGYSTEASHFCQNCNKFYVDSNYSANTEHGAHQSIPADEKRAFLKLDFKHDLDPMKHNIGHKKADLREAKVQKERFLLDLNRNEAQIRNNLYNLEMKLKTWVDDYIEIKLKKMEAIVKEKRTLLTADMGCNAGPTLERLKYLDHFIDSVTGQNFSVCFLGLKQFLVNQMAHEVKTIDIFTDNLPKNYSKLDVNDLLDDKKLTDCFVKFVTNDGILIPSSKKLLPPYRPSFAMFNKTFVDPTADRSPLSSPSPMSTRRGSKSLSEESDHSMSEESSGQIVETNGSVDKCKEEAKRTHDAMDKEGCPDDDKCLVKKRRHFSGNSLASTSTSSPSTSSSATPSSPPLPRTPSSPSPPISCTPSSPSPLLSRTYSSGSPRLSRTPSSPPSHGLSQSDNCATCGRSEPDSKDLAANSLINWIQCEKCRSWYHEICLPLDAAPVKTRTKGRKKRWFCPKCK